METEDENIFAEKVLPLLRRDSYGINKLRQAKANEGSHVLVTILTDGMENASKEYNKGAIKSLVEEMKGKKWTFTYIGTDHDVEAFASSIAIKNTMFFGKNEEGLNEMFKKEKKSRSAYSKKISENEDTEFNFYSD